MLSASDDTDQNLSLPIPEGFLLRIKPDSFLPSLNEMIGVICANDED
jgi:hypothetical protein